MSARKLLLSFFISFLWVLIAGNRYSYNFIGTETIGSNFFPFILWGIGLFFAVELFNLFRKEVLKERKQRRAFLIFCLFYAVFLILVETIGYHILGIHNDAMASYSGLPVCDCMHAVWWMKIVYFCLGPIYYLATLKKQNLLEIISVFKL